MGGIKEGVTYRMTNLVLEKNSLFTLEEVMADFESERLVCDRQSTKEFLNYLLESGLLLEHYPYFSVRR